MDKQQIIKTIQDHLPALKREFHIRSLGLFGSHARGNAKRASDVDILVNFDETPDLLLFIELEYRLGDLLGERVDLVMKDALKPAIGKCILKEAIPI